MVNGSEVVILVMMEEGILGFGRTCNTLLQYGGRNPCYDGRGYFRGRVI